MSKPACAAWQRCWKRRKAPTRSPSSIILASPSSGDRSGEHMPKILIVGASRGLGLGLAQEFAGRGWDVIATAREPKRADKLADLVKSSDGRVKMEQADVDDVKTIDALRARLADQ